MYKLISNIAKTPHNHRTLHKMDRSKFFYNLQFFSAEAIAKALVAVWISRLGIPRRITIEGGTQFLSVLFRELNSLLGVDHLKTTPYHPQADGIIERWHRTLKSAIKCHHINDWYNALPLILLGIRTTIKGDSEVTPADLVYRSKLKLPGEFFSNQKILQEESEFIKDLKRSIAKL